ncbi:MULTISPECIES: acyltransferase family protein [Paraburkholderia]|uniref:Acyltransferase n=1 Tax=Paraburkholderia podalyriae TaxID=1938811 RepID=A0ABR7PP65_9BURK|nr:acyltransferase [Paraburkholderia podalyriae]MBC8748046.1 acyltransferase [Paraburkholderia podalyriae]
MTGIRKYRSIQALRALAALGVVAFHTNGIVAAHGWLVHVFPRVSRYGEIGVDVFFVISGFVMALVTHGLPPGIESARSFICARIARVVPLYWILTALFIALVAFVPGVPEAFDHARVSAWHALSSFLFLPSTSWTGIAAPVLGVGWTLNYEMWFYAVFAVAMSVTRRRLLAVGAFLLVTSALHLLPGEGVAFAFYTNPLVLEFVFGCCVGAWYASGRTVPLAAAAGLLVVVAAAGAFAPRLTDANRFLVFGLPALAVVVAGLSVESKVRWSRWLERIGDASYSLYLTHLLAMPVVIGLLQMIDARHRWPGDLVGAVVVVGSSVVALGSYRWVERPASRAVARWIAGLSWGSAVAGAKR